MIILKIVLLSHFSTTLWADSPEWKLVKNKDSIKVFQMQKEGFRLKHHKATTTINTNQSSLLAVFRDAQSCPDWIYNCVSNKLIKQINDQERIYYTIIDSPLMFKDRDMYLHSLLSYKPTSQHIVINLKPQAKDIVEYKDRVRIKNISMIWTLIPIHENETKVIYEIYLDPLIPFKKIVNKIVLDSVFYTLKNLSAIVKNDKYQNSLDINVNLYIKHNDLK